MQQLPTTRTLGPFRGCCKPFAVEEVGKHDGGWCSKSTACNGCSVYETRPEECRKFACVWLNGLGETSDGPDILGVMMDVQDLQLGEREVGIFHLWEIEVGAMDRPRVQQMAEANKDVGMIVYYHRMLGEKNYRLYVELSRSQFSDTEIAEFEELYYQQRVG